MNLGDRLKNIHEHVLEERKQKALDRHRKEQEALETKAKRVLDPLPEYLEEQALKGIRWGTIQRPVKTNAEHHPPQSRSTKNICRPEDLIEESALIYQKCVDELGLTVKIRYWQEHDYDEPGAYIGGYEMVAVW